MKVGRKARWIGPGRVNLIGEHTDYNAGLALPFAIEQGCVAEVSIRSADFAAVSAQFGEVVVSFEEAERLPSYAGPTWVRYALGPVWALRQAGIDIPPLQVRTDSGVPIGAGLSSSAAVICAVTTAIVDLVDAAVDNDALLAVTRAVENEVVGAPTGGLDQWASLRCRPGAALLCDFSDGSSRQVRFDPVAAGLAVLVVDTKAPHRHADGEYAQRRAGCERAAVQLGIPSLREVRDLDSALEALGDAELRRYVRHVVTENARVERVVDLLEDGRVGDIGPLLSASHASLRDEYRVTVPQLDMAVAVLEETGALGARMTGGGFGGCVIALVPASDVDHAVEAVMRVFAREGFTAPGTFVVQPSAGARRLLD